MNPSLDYHQSVVPQVVRVDLLLTARSPISHHDPAVTDDSNTLLFNRQKQLLSLPALHYQPLPEQVAAFCQDHPFPQAHADLLSLLTFPEFVTCALTRAFLDEYNRGEGTGVLSGVERYERLRTRLRHAAVRSGSLRDLWSRLCDDMECPVAAMSADAPLLRTFALPLGLQQLCLRAAITHSHDVVMIAREWHDAKKLSDPEYRRKSGREEPGEFVVPAFTPADAPDSKAEMVAIDVPALSANSLRHQVVRAPGALHLLGALGFAECEPGYGDLPPGAEALFVNGGNIRSGAKQPSDPFRVANFARQRYPLLDLLGGVTDSFDVGESRVKVASWLVCKENAHSLRGTNAADLPEVHVSAFDMLDDCTHTRQATRQGVGQMIFNSEALVPGTRFLCRLALMPFTRSVTASALAAALKTYLAGYPIAGGQSARGYGVVDSDLLTEKPALPTSSEYEEYLDANKQALREGLIDGTLGSGVKVLS